VKTTPIYILGTGLSHDGSACILQDGVIKIAIEKERITRIKHDGGNDSAAVQYCLDAMGIQFSDLSLVVQAANFEKDISPERYRGKRFHHPDVNVITISHHLAHAYSAVATSPFKECNVLVIDGAGSPVSQCDDWPDEETRNYWMSMQGHYCEKDSFYRYADHKLTCLQKDFSECRLYDAGEGTIRMPTNYHSIGGLYAAASNYCFGNLDDAGKLMGLAPYGKDTFVSNPVFILENGIVSVDHAQMERLQTPASDYSMFKENFRHYADVARWIQKETERAVTYIAHNRMERFPHENLAYAGGVALNAVCNSLLLKNKIAQNLYTQPAAGDNGLSIGCAYYGWNHVLGKEISAAESTTVFFGKPYDDSSISFALETHPEKETFNWTNNENYIELVTGFLAEGRVVGWFQGGAEFGPRALGHRSILADPRRKDVQQHINANIKFREDFRPFAPAVLKEEVNTYFVHGWDSPYMILIDDIRDEWRERLPGIVHVDGTCRVQTVEQAGNEAFYALLQSFKEKSEVAVLVNTSFNRKGMPIVETPAEALDFFLCCDLDVLVMDGFVVQKNRDIKRPASISS
jgi:carbamoyltransferase